MHKSCKNSPPGLTRASRFTSEHLAMFAFSFAWIFFLPELCKCISWRLDDPLPPNTEDDFSRTGTLSYVTKYPTGRFSNDMVLPN